MSHFWRADTAYTNSIARETCNLPKCDILDNLISNTVLNSKVTSRFKYCKGKPVCHVSDIDYTRSGTNAKAVYILCKKRTNWHCILYRN